MAFASDHLLYIAFGAIAAGTIILLVVIDHLNHRVKLHAKVMQTEAREQTRREIAAYVAEGSISPEDGARLMASGAEGLDGLKSSLQGIFSKGADACRSAGESARQAAAKAGTPRAWSIRIGDGKDEVRIGACEDGGPA